MLKTCFWIWILSNNLTLLLNKDENLIHLEEMGLILFFFYKKKIKKIKIKIIKKLQMGSKFFNFGLLTYLARAHTYKIEN